MVASASGRYPLMGAVGVEHAPGPPQRGGMRAFERTHPYTGGGPPTHELFCCPTTS